MSAPFLLPIGTRQILSSGGLCLIRGYASRGSDGQPAAWSPALGPPAFYVVEASDKVACVPVSRAAESLRPLVSADVANDLLSTLRGPAQPLSAEPMMERGKRVAHSGTPDDHAVFLRELYGLPLPLSPTLRQGRQFFESLVLPELEAVLGLLSGTLTQEMSQRYPVE